MAAAGARIVEVERFGTEPVVDRKVFEVLTGERDRREDTALLVSNYLMCPQGMVGVETFSYFLAADSRFDRLDHAYIPCGPGATGARRRDPRGAGGCRVGSGGVEELAAWTESSEQPRAWI